MTTDTIVSVSGCIILVSYLKSNVAIDKLFFLCIWIVQCAQVKVCRENSGLTLTPGIYIYIYIYRGGHTITNYVQIL